MPSISMTLSGLCALVFMAHLTAHECQAQNLVTATFGGKVSSAGAEGTDYDGPILLGDRISGTITYDPSIPMESLSDRLHIFDFDKTAGMSFTVKTGDLEFASVAHPPEPDKHYLRAQYTKGLISGTTDRWACEVAFSYQNFHDETLVDGDTRGIDLSMRNIDIDFERDYQALPGRLELEDWQQNSHYISVQYIFDGRHYFFVAKIDKLESNTIESGIVSGHVFNDLNSNCAFDEVEPTISRQIIEFLPGPYYTISDINGSYSTRLPLGAYTASRKNKPLWENLCSAEPISVSLESDGQERIIDFGLHATLDVEALDVSIMSIGARPGFPVEYKIRLENVGTLPYSGTLRFIHDMLLTEFTSSPAADNYSAPSAEWYIEDMPLGAIQEISVTLKVPADETLLGTIICAQVESETDPRSDDEILRTAADRFCMEIRGAYDPNDMQVFSGNHDADGPILPEDKVLTYMIRFQNEGNAEALTVRVVDQLSSFHKVTSLRLGATSHPAEVNIRNNGELEWTFNDINLPPKSEDEAASQGFIKFEVTLKDELGIGSVIPNSAAIYFDFNSPVITNTVHSRIVNPSTSVKGTLDEASVQVFPNPTADKLSLFMPQRGLTTLTLQNSQGKVLLSENFDASAHELDLRAYAGGAYFLNVQTANGSVQKPINIVR